MYIYSVSYLYTLLVWTYTDSLYSFFVTPFILTEKGGEVPFNRKLVYR